MTEIKDPKVEKLLWIDLEMTGLNVQIENIIECAAIITDLNFQNLAQYHSVVFQPQALLEKMDAWNQSHHKASGLLEKIPFGRPLEDVENDLLGLIGKHFASPGERPILAGNSIAQDRLFIDKYMPKLSARLHYRMVDVTSYKVLLLNKFGIKYEKKNAHRALDDIQESIDELKFYLSHFS